MLYNDIYIYICMILDTVNHSRSAAMHTLCVLVFFEDSGRELCVYL